jgi:hypothetical protein
MGLFDTDSADSTASSGGDWTSRIGGLLGGPRDDQLAPIIGKEGLSNARTNALLNLGLGMMAASGWRPGPRATLGQVFAQGMGQAQQAYQGSLDASLKGAVTAQQLQAARLQMAQRLYAFRALQDAFPDATGSPLPAGAPMSATPSTPAATPGLPAPITAAGNGPVPAPSTAAAPITAPQTAGAPVGAPQAATAPMPTAAAATPTAAAPMADDRTAKLRKLLLVSGVLDPQNARGLAAAIEPSLPEYKQLDDGTIVNMKDPSIANTFHGKLMDGNATLGPGGVVTLRPGVAGPTGALAQTEQVKANANMFGGKVAFNPMTGQFELKPGIGGPNGVESQVAQIAADATARNNPNFRGVTANGTQYATTGPAMRDAQNPPLPPSVPVPQGMPTGNAPGATAAPMPGQAVPAMPAATAPAAGVPAGAIVTENNPTQNALNAVGGDIMKTAITDSSAAIKDAAITKQTLARNDQLLKQTKADASAPAVLAAGKYFQSLGMLSAKDSQNVDKIQELQNNEAASVMASLKASFPGRITNADLNFAMQSLAGKGQSNLAARVMNGIAYAKVDEAENYNRFVNDYAGQVRAGAADPTQLAQAWAQHQAQAPSIWESPMLLNSGALSQKTTANGTFVSIPGRGWLPVTRTQSGMLAPKN